MLHTISVADCRAIIYGLEVETGTYSVTRMVCNAIEYMEVLTPELRKSETEHTENRVVFINKPLRAKVSVI